MTGTKVIIDLVFLCGDHEVLEFNSLGDIPNYISQGEWEKTEQGWRVKLMTRCNECKLADALEEDD